jgi:chromosome segregation ATPase
MFLSVSAAQAEFYRWVDKDGKEFFTNERQKVPREYRDNAAAVSPDASRVRVGEKTAPQGRAASGVQEHKDKLGRGEEYWRTRAGKIRKELASLEDKYDLLLKQEKKEKDNPRKPGASAVKSKNAVSSMEKRKASLEKDLARKRHELDVELPDEARRLEAYPGWIR